jgi:DNA primase
MLSHFLQEKIDILIDLLESFLGEPTNHYGSKAQVSFDCPVCSAMKGVQHDGKGNLEVNYELGVFKCWSCSETDDTHGFLYKLFKEHSDKDTLKRFRNLGLTFGESEYYADVTEFSIKEQLQLPSEFIPLTGRQHMRVFKNAFTYLHNRGITDEDITKYNIGYCLEGLYQFRVVIPSYDANGDLNYFVTRAISSKVKKFKYLNSATDKTSIIFNEKLIDWNKPVFLVEGCFDHIPVGNSIPLLGKKLYDLIYDAVYRKANNYVIIILDPDAWEDAKKIYHRLNSGRLYKKVLINKLPDGYDLSLYNQLYGKEELRKIIIKSTRLKE